MDSFQIYTYGTAAWLSLQAIPLLVAPRLLFTLLVESSAREVSDLETYFARTTALAQLALAALTLIHSDLLTQDPDLDTDTDTDNPTSKPAKPQTAIATLILTTLYHLATCIYTYMTYTSTSSSQRGSTGMYLLGSVGAGALATMGLFVLMFGDERARGSRWPFESPEERAKRKERRRRRLGKGL